MKKAILFASVAVLLAFGTNGSGTPGPGEESRGTRFREGRPVDDDGGGIWPAGIPATREFLPRPELPAGGPSAPSRLGALVSEDRMLADLGELTRFGADRLYRTSGTSGEREAFEWLAGRVSALRRLAALGATVERPHFRVPLSSEVRRAELSVRVGGVDVTVPAHALQGHRDSLALALRFDSDGSPNDDQPDPVVVEGDVLVVQRLSDVAGRPAGTLAGTVVVADYALLDRGVVTTAAAAEAAAALLRLSPSALILVTRYSNVRGEAHGSFVGDVSVLTSMSDPPPVPTLYVKLEDLADAGIDDLSELSRIDGARVAWDEDVFSPGESQLLVLRVPGVDPSRAIVVGAHLDSPNSSGALDNGSGSVALLEAARVLDEAGVRPPVETLFAWFGSHERGLFGSSVFANANAALLQRAVAMVQLDCLTHPLDGMTGRLVSEAQSYRALGDARIPMPVALSGLAARAGVRLEAVEVTGITSDNSSFDGFDIPSANTIFLADAMTEVHVDGHLHDPYDDLPLAGLHRDDLADLAKVGLAAAVELPRASASLRTTPEKTRRAVFVASHTEAVHMTPAQLGALGMALAWEGWAVDVVPYGTAVTGAALSGAGLVAVLPVVDYPAPVAGPEPYDEAFSPAEVAVLEAYAREGGFLVLANSGARLRYGTAPVDENEDWPDLNAVGSGLGVTFEGRALAGTVATVAASHPLVAGLGTIALTQGNGLAVRPGAGRVLARSGSDAAIVLFTAGSRGEVLAIGDLGILGGRGAAPNLEFFRRLAVYAGAR
ncbi:MAG: M28 family peptidase [Holophagales bacterium]|nr:M28 family peptidase [Holophagales bacterium]MBK9966461.1 M28 family peptidase [Holophagales bacterium]